MRTTPDPRDYREASQRHRPLDADAQRAAALEMRQRGYSTLIIADALRISSALVEQLLRP